MPGSIEPNLPAKGDSRGTSDARTRGSLITLRDELNALLTSENKVARESLEESAQGFRWYTPKVIATEESTGSLSFTTLTTPDEIKSIVLPENGLLAVGYSATFKGSASGNAATAMFLGANQIKADSRATEPTAKSTTSPSGEGANRWRHLTTGPYGLGVTSTEVAASDYSGDVTTGQFLSGYDVTTATGSGFAVIFAAAGTYDLSVKFKVVSGSVAAKNRKLWAMVLG